MISLIAIMGSNRVIGDNGRIPDPLFIPQDRRLFRDLTMAKPVIMGRKTWESIPLQSRPLSGRTNIVLSRSMGKKTGMIVAHTIEESLALCGRAPEVMVIGGGQIYDQFFPLARRIYLSVVGTAVAGNTLFPDYDNWGTVTSVTHHPRFSFIILEASG